MPSLRAAPEVSADPTACALRPAEHAGHDRFVAHVDVDAPDLLQHPVADVPKYGRCVSPDTLIRVLTGPAGHPGFGGCDAGRPPPDGEGRPGSVPAAAQAWTSERSTYCRMPPLR